MANDYPNLSNKKHFKKRENPAQDQPAQTEFEVIPTKELLNEADFSSAVPSSIVENTTKRLNEISRK